MTPDLVLTIRPRPTTLNTRDLGSRWAMIRRRKQAIERIGAAYLAAASDRRVAVLDLPRQRPGERWRLVMRWRYCGRAPDIDNAMAATKPYVDACLAGGVAPILIDDAPRFVERPAPILERVKRRIEEELVFEFTRLKEVL